MKYHKHYTFGHTVEPVYILYSGSPLEAGTQKSGCVIIVEATRVVACTLCKITIFIVDLFIESRDIED